jgi:hydrogenase-1 operon protein HyaE
MTDALAPFPPLVARLVSHHGVALAASEEALGGGRTLVFCPGDARRVPESSDVAVVLPELCAAFAGRVTPWLVTPELEQRLRLRHGVRVEPALLVLADGRFVTAITGMCDWAVFVAQLGDALGREPGPQRVGLPVLEAEVQGAVCAPGGSQCG